MHFVQVIHNSSESGKAITTATRVVNILRNTIIYIYININIIYGITLDLIFTGIQNTKNNNESTRPFNISRIE